MLHDVLRKTLHDQRRSYPAWCVAILLLVAMYLALWPSIKGQLSMQDFLAQMPEAFRNLFAMAGADMSTPVGYIQIELLSSWVPSSSCCMPWARGRRPWRGRRTGAPSNCS